MLDHFDVFASVYDRLIGPPDAARFRELLRLPGTGWMLDAGGGTGRVSSALRPFIDHLVISDLSLQMLKQAYRKRGLFPVQAHVEALPFPDGCFNRILVVDALHHFCDQAESLRELVRVLKPEGRLVVEEPNIHRLPVKLVALAETLAFMRSHFAPPEAIRDLLITFGLRVSLIMDDRFRAWIIADKEGGPA